MRPTPEFQRLPREWLPLVALFLSGTALVMTVGWAEEWALSYRSHWIGSAATGTLEPPTADGLAVAADGTCVVASSTEDGSPSITLYRDGGLIGRAAAIPDCTHAFTGAVAVSENHIFAAIILGSRPVALIPAPEATTTPPPGRVWHGLWRFTRDGHHAPSPGGGASGGAFLRLHESAEDAPAAVTGVWVHEGIVFVSDAATGRIRTIDEVSLEPTGNAFPADRPSGLCVLAGKLQVIERGAVVSAFTLDGKRTGQVLDEGDELLPGAVAPTPEGRLMVSDRGPGQQVHFFNMSGVPTRVRTLGEEAGAYGPPTPGETGPRRFAGITGVGADAAGGLHVAQSPPPGGFVLRQFAPDRRTLRWEIETAAPAHGADIDPRHDGREMYSAEGLHTLELEKPPGASLRWTGLTVHPFRYPQDWRLAPAPPRTTPATGRRGGTTSFVEVNGHPQLAIRSPDGSRLSLYRFAQRTAVPALVIDTGTSTSDAPAFDFPDRPRHQPWIWRDANGNGHAEPDEVTAAPAFAHSRFPASPIDARGGLWLATSSRDNEPPTLLIAHWKCEAVDSHGIPVYPAEPSTRSHRGISLSIPATDPFHDFVYHPATDTLYQIVPGETGSSAGPLAVSAHDGWIQQTRPDALSLRPRWICPLPESFGPPAAPGLAVAGALVFIRHSTSRDILVVRSDTGTIVGTIRPPASKETAAITRASPALRAHRRQDGSYLVLIQDPTARRVLVHHLDDPLVPTRGE
jgi:hypothetical protein